MARIGASIGLVVGVLSLATIGVLVGLALWRTDHHTWFWIAIGIDAYLVVMPLSLAFRQETDHHPYDSRAGFARLPLRAQRRRHDK